MKFKEIQKCSRCAKECEALFTSGLVENPCCSECYAVLSQAAINAACNPVGDKSGVTTKTVEAAVKENVK